MIDRAAPLPPAGVPALTHRTRLRARNTGSRVIFAVALLATGLHLPPFADAQDFEPLPAGTEEVTGSYAVSISNPAWIFNDFAREWQDHCTYRGYHSVEDRGTGTYGVQAIRPDGSQFTQFFRPSFEFGTLPSGENVPSSSRWYFGGGGSNRCSAVANQAARLGAEWAERRTRYFFADGNGTPEADFGSTAGGPLLLEVAFSDESTDPEGEPLTHAWDFGDGSSSTEASPTHTYMQPGAFDVTLTVTDPGGLQHSREYTVQAGQALEVGIDVTSELLSRGAMVPAQLTLRNVSETPLTGVDASSLWTNGDDLIIVDGPDPAIPSTLGPGEQVTLAYTLETLTVGRLPVLGVGSAVMDEFMLEAFGEGFLTVVPDLEVTLNSDADAETVVGDTFTVTATLTNADVDPISEISTGALTDPSALTSAVSGPTAADGSDPRVTPITLAPGESTTITWVRMAEESGATTLSAVVTGRVPNDSALFAVDASTEVAIDLPDVSVLATSSFAKSGDAVFATYTITLTNDGGPAENVTLRSKYRLSERLTDTRLAEERTGFPKQLHVTAISESRCTGVPAPFVGGSFTCNLSLPGKDDPLGNNVAIIDIEARVVNVADLPSLTFEAVVPNDKAPSDNEDTASSKPALSDASLAQTRQAMTVLDAHFDYQTDLLELACNSYRRDIYARFERIRQDNSQVFANLSYGPVTSGDYTTEVGSRAGHVGLVVYPRGTDYRETGIVVHGTPSVSPLGAFADSYDTRVGQFPMGEQPLRTRTRGTSVHGYYYRTPAVQFPGLARPENEGCGFEGRYVDNGNEFSRPKSCVPPAKEFTTCPFEPRAVVITTESPVDIRATNAAGEQVETLDGVLVNQELAGGIHSLAFPHADGTYGWMLVLPADDYDVELIGMGDGPYRLIMTRFDRAGDPVETIIAGVAEPGQIETFRFFDTLIQDGFEGAD